MRVDPQVHELAVFLARHQRLDPMTSRDRCTCGRATPLGRMFHEHVAVLMIQQGWSRT